MVAVSSHHWDVLSDLGDEFWFRERTETIKTSHDNQYLSTISNYFIEQ